MALHFLDNVFGLDFALEPPQGTLDRLTFLQSNLCQIMASKQVVHIKLTLFGANFIALCPVQSEIVNHFVQEHLADSHIHLCNLPWGRYVFEVSVTLGDTHHLSLGFQPVVESVPVGIPSLFVQLISSVANSIFQFGEAYLPEIGVGRAQLKLHDFRSFLLVSVGTQDGARWRFLQNTPSPYAGSRVGSMPDNGAQ